MSAPKFSGNITFPTWALHFEEVRKSAAQYVEYAEDSHDIQPADLFILDCGKWRVDPALVDNFTDEHEVTEVNGKIIVNAICRNGYLSDLEMKLKRYAVPFDSQSLGREEGGDYSDVDNYHRYDDFLRHSKKEVYDNGDYLRPDLDLLRDKALAGDTDGIIASIDAFKKSIKSETTILDCAPKEERLRLRMLISFIHAKNISQADKMLKHGPKMLAETDTSERIKILSTLHQHWDGDATGLAWCVENGMPLEKSDVDTLRENGIEKGQENPLFFCAVQALLSRQAMNKIISAVQRSTADPAP
jgi:hypothetical protein